MAFPRYFFALCAVLVFVVVGGIHAEVNSESIELNSAELEVLKNYLAEEDGDSVEERGLILEKIKEILRKALKLAANAKCLGEAVIHCKKHWKNPKAFIDCAREYLSENEERCVKNP